MKKRDLKPCAVLVTTLDGDGFGVSGRGSPYHCQCDGVGSCRWRGVDVEARDYEDDDGDDEADFNHVYAEFPGFFEGEDGGDDCGRHVVDGFRVRLESVGRFCWREC